MPTRPLAAGRPIIGGVVKVTDRDQLAVGQRSHKHVWQPAALLGTGAFAQSHTNAADTAIRMDAPTATPPLGAVGIKVIVAITSNTVTAQVLQWLCFAEKSATSVSTGAALAWSFPNAQAANVLRNSFDCPLVDGCLRWQCLTSGTPRFDVDIFHTGWILG